MRKRHLLTAVLIMSGGVFGFAGMAHANPSQASATCQGGIVYEGHDYPSAGSTVTVKIDGATVAGFPKTFGPAVSGTVQFTDKTVGHSWAVVWDRFNGTDGDRTQSGTVQACQVAPTTTIVPATTTTVTPTTTTVADATTTTIERPRRTVPDITQPPATVAELATVPVLPTPPATTVVVSTGEPIVLPATGVPSGLLLAIAFALCAAGASLLYIRRGARRT